MDEDQSGQLCGNCGAANAKDAVVCASCGVVLSAYAALANESAGGIESSTVVQVDPTPTPPVPTTERRPDASRPPTGGDWRSMFERTPEMDHLTPDVPEPAPFMPSTVAPVTPPAATAETETPRAPATPAPRSSGKAEKMSAPPAPPAPQSKPATTRVSTGTQPAATSAASSRPTSRAAGQSGQSGASDAQRKPTNREFQAVIQAPMRLIYAGLALFLGGCVFTGLLTAFTENSTAIGFALLCSMPIGFILLVIGIIMFVSRREGRNLK